jgi:hypothetical protein
LTAGFEMLTQNLQVVALPVVLDLILWLGPRVSIAPLLNGFARILGRQPAPDAQMAAQMEQAMELLKQFAGRFNLLSTLAGVPMFQIPSLLARRAPAAGSPLGSPQVFSISSILALVPWWAALGVLGLILGFLYLNEIANQVENGVMAPARSEGESGETTSGNPDGGWRDSLLKLARFLVFALGLAAVGSVVLPLWILMVAVGATVAEPLGVLLWVVGVGLISYAAMHLLFVIPSLLLGGRPLLGAIGESLLLSHVSLSSVFGFVLLALVIYEGLGYAWSLPNSDSWAMLIGILGNAFVATGLTGAAFVFYRDRVLVGQRMVKNG